MRVNKAAILGGTGLSGVFMFTAGVVFQLHMRGQWCKHQVLNKQAAKAVHFRDQDMGAVGARRKHRLVVSW